jgi:agmatinase
MGENTNFADVPAEYAELERARVVVLPVPFDMTSSWMPGSHKGPDAIISASAHMELYDIETGTEPYRQGIHTAEPVEAGSPEEMVEQTHTRTAVLLAQDKFVVTLGGEHTVSLGPIRAHHEKWPDMSVLHLDAHGDRREEFEGSRLSHACVMARVAEFCPHILSVGIRSMDISERPALQPSRTFYASAIHGKEGWERNVVKRLKKDVYVTIDLDVFDPGVMPSTGTPEPGGMAWYEALGLLDAVSKERNIIGMDVVELCPSANRAPDFLAAKLIYKVLALTQK